MAGTEAFVAGGAWVSLLVLMETVWVLTSVYERSPAQAVAVVEMLLDHDTLSVQDADVVHAALAQYREAPRPGFSDCLMLQITRKAGHTPLGTFDRRSAALEGAQRL